MQITTRFAPSNTGKLHLGSARTALFSYAYGKKPGNKTQMRAEDTDPARSTEESLMDILKGLEWLGLKFDEQPSIEEVKNGIKRKEVFQSKQSEEMEANVQKLIKNGHAYVNEEGTTMFRMNAEDCILPDLILGAIKFPGSDNKDFAIKRKDGSHLFHLAVVTSDILAGVNLVSRANDHSQNTAKHIAIYKALGVEPPMYAHMPLILSQDGDKLSKRRTDQSAYISDYKDMGMLPETVIQTIAMLGWSCKEEDFGLDYMIKNFEFRDCNKNNPKFDFKKMIQINSSKIKKMPPKKFSEILKIYGTEYFPKAVQKLTELGVWDSFCSAYQPRSTLLRFPFENGKWAVSKPKYKPEDVAKCKVESKGLIILEHIANSGKIADIDNLIKEQCDKAGMKPNIVGQLLRLALTGQLVAPGLKDIFQVITPAKIKGRINSFLETLAIKV